MSCEDQSWDHNRLPAAIDRGGLSAMMFRRQYGVANQIFIAWLRKAKSKQR